jgi:hypothetical protein
MNNPLEFFTALVYGSKYQEIRDEFESRSGYSKEKDLIHEYGHYYSPELEETIEYEDIHTFREHFEKLVRKEIRIALAVSDQESYKTTSREHLKLQITRIIVSLKDLINKESEKDKPDPHILDALRKMNRTFLNQFTSLKQVYNEEIVLSDRLRFDVNQNELIVLFLILRQTGIINSQTEEIEIANFIQATCQFIDGKSKELKIPTTVAKKLNDIVNNQTNPDSAVDTIISKLKGFKNLNLNF